MNVLDANIPLDQCELLRSGGVHCRAIGRDVAQPSVDDENITRFNGGASSRASTMMASVFGSGGSPRCTAWLGLKADERGTVPPEGIFEATVQPDSRIRLVEVAPVPVVKPLRVNGRLRGADIRLSRETVATAIRAERDAR